MDIINIVNTIRDQASNDYQSRIPEATRNNIETVRAAMLSAENVTAANEFMATLLNKIVRTEIIKKSFQNPLRAFKKGKKPVGDTVEEIYTNFLKGDPYDPNGNNLLKRNLPDTKTAYHRMNRKATYKVTVNEAELSRAFMSWESLNSYVQNTIDRLASSAELDEYVLMRELITDAYNHNALVVKTLPDPCASEENARAFIKGVKIVSGDMAFPNDRNNAYLTAQSEDKLPIITLSSKDEQVLILDNSVDVTLSVDVLANIFNKSIAEFNDTSKAIVDAFTSSDISGALVDKNFFQVFDDLYLFKRFENPESLYDNYYLHVWQTMAYSILVNAVVFKKAADASGADA